MDRIPNFDEAFVDETKLLGYLLAGTHPVGREKARFFLAVGFRQQSPAELRWALLRHGRENPIVARQLTSFGAKYVVEGPLRAPSGSHRIRSIWFIPLLEKAPRLVTAYPLRGAAK